MTDGATTEVDCTAAGCTRAAVNPRHPAPLCRDHLPDGLDPADVQLFGGDDR